MFFNPFIGSWANYFLDVVDGDVLLTLGMSETHYQTLDKVADLFAYVIMFLVGKRWRIGKTITLLFVYRAIGQVLYFATGNEIVFFYFQNFLEPLVMTYALLLFKNKTDEKAYLSYQKHRFLIWGIILTYKIWNEWMLHLANIDLSLLLLGHTGGM